MFNKKNIFIFGKAQVSAFVGGMFDYSVMIFCVEYFHIHLKESIIIAGLLGAIINFSINKYWTYQSKKPSVTSQLIKFFLVVAGSIALKANGTVFLTQYFHVDYKITRIVVDLFVSIGFNFMLQKYWVFKTSTISDSIDNMSNQKENTSVSVEKREYQEA